MATQRSINSFLLLVSLLLSCLIAPASTAAPAAASNVVGKVARFNAEVPDVGDARQFYTDVFSLREVLGAGGESRASASRVELGDGIGLGSSVMLLARPAAAAAAAAATAAPPVAAPFGSVPSLTMAVSNLATAARHVQRRGGTIGEARGGAGRACTHA